jgi:hypothetical protein
VPTSASLVDVVAMIVSCHSYGFVIAVSAIARFIEIAPAREVPDERG